MEKVMKTMYRFTKCGHVYTVSGENGLEARLNAEIRFGINLKGAEAEEIYKLKTIRKWIVK